MPVLQHKAIDTFIQDDSTIDIQAYHLSEKLYSWIRPFAPIQRYYWANDWSKKAAIQNQKIFIF
jgi:hypothetical protein